MFEMHFTASTVCFRHNTHTDLEQKKARKRGLPSYVFACAWRVLEKLSCLGEWFGEWVNTDQKFARENQFRHDRDVLDLAAAPSSLRLARPSIRSPGHARTGPQPALITAGLDDDGGYLR